MSILENNIDYLRGITEALPDPVFVLSESGKYVSVFGGQDSRYYHDGRTLIGRNINDILNPEKSQWFVKQIKSALNNKSMTIIEYELSNKDVKGLTDIGPEDTLYFEGRIQPLEFTVEGERTVLWVASNISTRHDLEAQLRHLSETDQLTGLANRRKLERELSAHFASYVRYKTPTSVIMFDLDNLKEVNDSLGHFEGDKIIVKVAELCSAELRETDLACRFGGDEFIIVIPHSDLDEARLFAERLHHQFKTELKLEGAETENLSVSMGAATFLPKDNSFEDIIRRADKYLYEAKVNGKNQIVFQSA